MSILAIRAKTAKAYKFKPTLLSRQFMAIYEGQAPTTMVSGKLGLASAAMAIAMAMAGKAAMVWQQGQAKRSEYSMSKAQLLA